MVRSLALAVLLSLPLVACASRDGAPPAASASGASGGSPLAGSPAAPNDTPHTDRSSARDISWRDISTHERSARSEHRIGEAAVCRQCR